MGDFSEAFVKVDGLNDIDVLGGIKFSDGVVLRKSFVVVTSISDFELFSSPSYDSLIEVSP